MAFKYTNKQYCQLIYEYTGVWAERVAYATDNSEYYFYFNETVIDRLENELDRIEDAIIKRENATAFLDRKNCCLIMTARL